MPFENIQAKKIFLINPQNERSTVNKKRQKMTEIVASAFIGILQNIFRGWAIIFSQSSKVVTLTNCAFPLSITLNF